MKAPQITEPVFGYNSEGKRHRASNDVLEWLKAELSKAEDIYLDRSKEWAKTSGIIEEMELLEQDSVLETLRYVYQYLTSHTD